VLKAIRRIGEAFASGLDREALLELGLRTAMDATQADRGRVSGRESIGEASADGLYLATVALGPIAPEGPTHGLRIAIERLAVPAVAARCRSRPASAPRRRWTALRTT
jgi:hypothetical protein